MHGQNNIKFHVDNISDFRYVNQNYAFEIWCELRSFFSCRRGKKKNVTILVFDIL